MKKLIVITALVSMFACTENTSNVNITITQIDTTQMDSLNCLDSIGIKQIQVMDSLQKKGILK